MNLIFLDNGSSVKEIARFTNESKAFEGVVKYYRKIYGDMVKVSRHNDGSRHYVAGGAICIVDFK